ncbi:hypothetical protein BCV70DRAFT_198160 [Testicularia cyperi]|uniref:Uncharacterized protein n=1 Tax=Testicularia cyperi TaxID=1882483 RepID=A0A317XX14_9BASI|nr:hypothetical protein BCV70DRAFT_198160 [Testicularia cyperi]
MTFTKLFGSWVILSLGVLICETMAQAHEVVLNTHDSRNTVFDCTFSNDFDGQDNAGGMDDEMDSYAKQFYVREGDRNTYVYGPAPQADLASVESDFVWRCGQYGGQATPH